jgi:hypothetical protein
MNCGLVSVLACGGIACADVLTLTSGAERLSGVTRSIDGEGVVELDSELSTAPLRLRGAMLEKVQFPASVGISCHPEVGLTLSNGDMISCEIEGMNDRTLVVNSPTLGKITVDRRHLDAVQFGYGKNKVVYKGPKGLDEWEIEGEEGECWRFEGDALVTEGRSIACRKIGFPDRFVLKFEIEWHRHATPNFCMYFSDPLKSKYERCDRYLLQYGSSGLEIKRESATGRRYTSIVFINRLPNQCEGRRLSVEVHVDRQTSKLRLLLDGKPWGEFMDPVFPTPSGGGLALENRAVEAGALRVRGIEVLECDDTPENYRAGYHELQDRDGLITRTKERWSGSLEGISAVGAEPLVSFRNGIDGEFVKLPASEVSVILFARHALKGPSSHWTDSGYLVTLRGGCLLQVSSCNFSADVARLRHPLLGVLHLRRDDICMMEKLDLQTTKPTTQ